MSFSNNAFAKIGLALSNSQQISRSLPIPIKKSDKIAVSAKLDESITENKEVNTLTNSPDDCSIISETFTVEFNEIPYKFYVLLCNNMNIQIKVINHSNMDQFTEFFEKSFINNMPFISSIRVLYNIIIDSLKKEDTNVTRITLKLESEETIQFNIEYKTPYDKYIIPLKLKLIKIKESAKQSLIMNQLLKDNIFFKKNINKLQTQIANLNRKMNDLDSKLNNHI